MLLYREYLDFLLFDELAQTVRSAVHRRQPVLHQRQASEVSFVRVVWKLLLRPIDELPQLLLYFADSVRQFMERMHASL